MKSLCSKELVNKKIVADLLDYILAEHRDPYLEQLCIYYGTYRVETAHHPPQRPTPAWFYLEGMLPVAVSSIVVYLASLGHRVNLIVGRFDRRIKRTKLPTKNFESP